MKTIVNKYCIDNVSIRITDFELRDVSFYGCDAIFDLEIVDKETGVVIATDCEILENAFMGVDDSEELYYFLEDKGIDFSEKYDDDFSKLPPELQKEYEEYILAFWNDQYHDYFFESEDEVREEFLERIMKQLYLDGSLLYVISGDKVGFIKMKKDYFGIHLSSDDFEIRTVYNVDMEGWIYEVEGVFFDVTTSWGPGDDFSFRRMKRRKGRKHIVSEEDLENDVYPGYDGKAGDVLYDYDDV
ncbi:MAG: hypothetical protein IKS22_12715 [Bacteroidales bacterium]|nr:hypothetical protein [Bacteroidales bacterium]